LLAQSMQMLIDGRRIPHPIFYPERWTLFTNKTQPFGKRMMYFVATKPGAQAMFDLVAAMKAKFDERAAARLLSASHTPAASSVLSAPPHA
jgi:hypothetical protein